MADKKPDPPAAEQERGADTDLAALQTGAELARATTDAAVATTAALAGAAPRVLTRQAADETVPPDISPQTFGGNGKGYGEFVREVGMAVAFAQRALDENSVDSALRLAETEIPALVALNQVVNEDGEIESVQPVIQENARLIQYISPTFYAWDEVRLFARFDISSFSSDSETAITSSASASQRGLSLGGGLNFGKELSGSLRGGFSRGSSAVEASSQVDSSFGTASSSGTSFMDAVLRPRRDTTFPPPIVAVQGPRLSASATANSLAAPTGSASAQLRITFTVFHRAGFENSADKFVEVTLDGPGALQSTSVALKPPPPPEPSDDEEPEEEPMPSETPPPPVTTLSGEVELRRRPSDAPGTAVIRGRFGALTTTVTVEFPPAPASSE